MKTLFVILLFCITINVFSQKEKESTPFYGDSSIAKNVAYILISRGEFPNRVTRRLDNKEFNIYGMDSLSAIKLLWDLLDKSEKEQQKLKQYFHKSVEWSNTIGDYYKVNKEWKVFLEAMRKLGYKRVPIK